MQRQQEQGGEAKTRRRMSLHVDLRGVEARRRRSGTFLRCPRCCRWVRSLLVLGGGQLLCRGCRDVKDIDAER